MKNFAEWIFESNDTMDHSTILSTLTKDYSLTDIYQEMLRYVSLLRTQENLKGKKVALMVPSVFSYLSLVLAVNKLEGTVIPISPFFRKDDLTAVLETLDPHMIFTVTEHNGFDFGEVVRDWAHSTGNRTMIYESTDCNSWTVQETTGKERALEREHADIIACSSGSTGIPKGIMVTNKYIEFNNQGFSSVFNLHKEDCLFLMIPSASNVGLISILMGLYNRIPIVIPEDYDFPAMAKRLNEKSCNKLIATPSLFKALYMFAKNTDLRGIKRLEICGLAGENIPSHFIEDFSEMRTCKFRSLYGLSELGFLMYTEDIHNGLEWTIVPQVSHRVEGLNNGIGEIVFNVPKTFLGYYKRPDLTEEVYKNGWFYTGDLVEVQDGGQLKIVGRKKEMIKKGGQQVVPGEVEQILTQHPAVKQSVVIGIPHPVFGEQIIAFIEAKDVRNDQELYTYMQQRIARYKVPDKLIFLDKIPVSQGKVDKISLRKLALSE